MKLDDGFAGLEDFPGFDNYAKQPHNTCGQAVIASMLEYTQSDAIPVDRAFSHYQEHLLEQVFLRHGPHWPFRNWITNRRIITKALAKLAVPFTEHVTPVGARAALRKDLIVSAVAERKHPVIVLLDVRRLKLGPPFTLHWAVVYAVSLTHVRLSSWGRTYDIPWKDFLAAWRVWFLTYPYHYYMIEVTHP